MDDDSGESMEPMKSAIERTGWIEIGEIGAWLTDRSRELIPETRGSMLEGMIYYS